RDVDYEIDEPKRTVAVTEEGVRKVEERLGIDNLYEHVNTPLVHHMQNALRAKELYKRDVDYLVANGEVKIVDEFTGRVLEGRRYSEGLHQAIEAIEKSERLSGYLNRRGVPHHVLNAKQHEKEAMIVAQAGRKGAVTVATNMAGRGVDILLGGNPEYLARQEMAARGFDNDRYLMFDLTPEERSEYETEYEPIFKK